MTITIMCIEKNPLIPLQREDVGNEFMKITNANVLEIQLFDVTLNKTMSFIELLSILNFFQI